MDHFASRESVRRFPRRLCRFPLSFRRPKRDKGTERDKGTGVVYDGCLFQSEYYPRPLLPFPSRTEKSEEGEIVVLTADGKGQLSFSAHQSGRAGGVAQNALAHANGLWPLLNQTVS